MRSRYRDSGEKLDVPSRGPESIGPPARVGGSVPEPVSIGDNIGPLSLRDREQNLGLASQAGPLAREVSG